MKKSLLALAVLGAYVGVASAQSSVTLYGTADLNGRYIKNDGSKGRYSLSQDGINSSQLGFKGTEDLGGGLKAGFLLLAGLNMDTGSTNQQFFNRRSTVSLFGNFGEVRLGRDYTPTFWSTTIFDVFGTNGLGDSSGVKQLAAPDYVRANNMVQYLLPSNIGGVYGQLSAGAGEGTAAGRYVGGRVGFAAGPFDVAVAYASEKAGTGGIAPGVAGDQYKTFNVGGQYNFGVATIMGYFNQEKIESYKDNIFSISGLIPLGQGEIHLGADFSKLSAPVAALDGNKVKKYALGYVYNLSKRTALYTTGAIVDNGNASRVTLGSTSSEPAASGYFGNGQGSATAAPTAGGKSKGIEFGIRHFF